MQIRFADRLPDNQDALILPVAGTTTAIEARGAGLIEAARRQRFKGEAGDVAEQFEQSGRRVLAIGIGAQTKPADAAEKLGGTISAKLLTSGETGAVVDLTGLGFDADAAARVALAAALRAWRYDRYRTKLKDKHKPTLDSLTIVGAPAEAEARWTGRWKPVVDGVALTRELVAEPANIIYPESFVERCRHLTDLGVEIEVLGEAEMAKLGMGALLGVSQGSRREAQFLILRWNGGEAGGTPTVFIGKGVTFDTGGISIKPAAGMESMKWDMGGAGAVAGALKALAGRKAKANVVGICGLVENMPDGNAQRPGDIVTSLSGQTVEVINTDAEGRLVLCDALTWAQRNLKPATIVDLATLTGAMVVSLGHEFAGMFANDDTLADRLSAAAKESGDRLWRMPLGEAYDRLIDSPIADIKNVGPREGGAITAAMFLSRFVEEGVKWAHLDIAGMAWSDKASNTYDKGATGFGVRLLDQYVADVLEK
ncbi:MAG: leucyl aminopeptidase [Sphingomicrobium sp.]|nr:leucyl aminopeptidase [Sphingomonadales bacterium]